MGCCEGRCDGCQGRGAVREGIFLGSLVVESGLGVAGMFGSGGLMLMRVRVGLEWHRVSEGVRLWLCAVTFFFRGGLCVWRSG